MNDKTKPPLSTMIPGSLPYSAEAFNVANPIVKGKRYAKGIEVIRESMTERENANPGKKQKISGLSMRSLRKLAFTVLNSSIEFRSILTLTYGRNIPVNGKQIKQHLNAFLVTMSRHFGSFSYVWWLEFQTKRKVPHFHLLLTLPAPGESDRAKMAGIWAKVTFRDTTGMTDAFQDVYRVHSFSPKPGSRRKPAWEGIRKQDGAKWYILKYASKYEQKEVPAHFHNVGRFWATSRDVPNGDYTEIDLTEDDLRDYLKSKGSKLYNAPIIPKFTIVF